jgi:hypothetical protein
MSFRMQNIHFSILNEYLSMKNTFIASINRDCANKMYGNKKIMHITCGKTSYPF